VFVENSRHEYSTVRPHSSLCRWPPLGVCRRWRNPLGWLKDSTERWGRSLSLGSQHSDRTGFRGRVKRRAGQFLAKDYSAQRFDGPAWLSGVG